MAAKRDSDTDIRQLMPDLSTILKHADPAYGERIYREAMNNPELDEAVAERDRALAAMEAGEGADGSDPPGKTTTTPATAVPRVSAPSPWANAASGDAIDPSVLPSATAPKTEAAPAAPPVTSAVEPTKRAAAGGSTRRALPPWVFPGVVAIALAPFAMWAIMSMQTTKHPTSPVAGPGPSAQPATSVTSDSVPPPTLHSAAPAAATSPTPASSTASPPAVTGTPSTAVSVPHRQPGQRQPEPRQPDPSDPSQQPSGLAPTVDAGAPGPQPQDGPPGKGLRPEVF